MAELRSFQRAAVITGLERRVGKVAVARGGVRIDRRRGVAGPPGLPVRRVIGKFVQVDAPARRPGAKQQIRALFDRKAARHHALGLVDKDLAGHWSVVLGRPRRRTELGQRPYRNGIIRSRDDAGAIRRERPRSRPVSDGFSGTVRRPYWRPIPRRSPSSEPVTMRVPSGCDRHAADGAGMTLELEQFGAGAGVPHPRCAIAAAGDDADAVRRDRHGADGALVAGVSRSSSAPVPTSHTRAVPSSDR